MKKYFLVLVAFGLIFAAGCTSESPAEQSTAEQSTVYDETPIEETINNFVIEGESTDGGYIYEDIDVSNGTRFVVQQEGTGILELWSNEYKMLIYRNANYKGVVFVEDGQQTLKLKSDGPYNIHAEPLSRSENTTFIGNSDDVTTVRDYNSDMVFDVTHEGKGDFSVIQRSLSSDDYELLANVVGDYQGTITAKEMSDSFFVIKSDGEWEMKLHS